MHGAEARHPQERPLPNRSRVTRASRQRARACALLEELLYLRNSSALAAMRLMRVVVDMPSVRAVKRSMPRWRGNA